jgi:hypothetical protein
MTSPLPRPFTVPGLVPITFGAGFAGVWQFHDTTDTIREI